MCVDLYLTVFPDCFISVFDNIDQYLFELDAVYLNVLVFRCQR